MRIALLAGEASGDLLGAGLIESLRIRYPEASFAGIGGPKMQAAGMDCWWDSGQLAVMGLAEVLRHLPRLLRLRRQMVARTLEWRPDIFIGIDAPDFNLSVERSLKRAGLRTVHYVSPSIWAWREKRAERIGQSADRVLCLFPNEPPIYRSHGVDARFVGHPLADAFAMEPDQAAARHALGLAPDVPVLAMLPGSRQGEIRRLLPAFLQTARQLQSELPELQVLIPAANSACHQAIEAQLLQLPLDGIRLLDGQAHAAMIASDVVLLASGTAALEALLAKRPMVVAYRLSALTYRIVMALGLMKIDRYSLPNVLAGESLVPELMQDDCTPEKLAAAVLRAFRDGDARAALLPRYREIHRQLEGNASARAAEAVAELLDRRA